jgi:hypothetical protein
MKTILVISCIICSPFSALAQSIPIQQSGGYCPLGYYSSSGYCVPSYGNPRKWSVNAAPNTACPLGTYKSGNYCTKSYGSR